MISKISNNIANFAYSKPEAAKPEALKNVQYSNRTEFPQGLNIHMYTGNISTKNINFKGLVAENIDLVEYAKNFAKEKHGKQLYGEGPIKRPYTYHTQGVADLVSKYTDDPEIIAAAHLHDTIEDTDTKYEELCSKFGRRVANLVLSVTTNKEEKERLGKTKAIANKVIIMDEDSLLIKLCDRKFNVDNLDDAEPNFKRKYALETSYIMGRLLGERADIPFVCKKLTVDILMTLDRLAF
jgi:(p)ppGpp synthase/HD superfamily hydrolase